MLTQEQDLENMRLYFNEQLKGESLKVFEQKLKDDSDFKQRVFIETMVFKASQELFNPQNAISKKGLQKAKTLVDELQDDLFDEPSNFWEGIEVDIDIEPVYSLQELLAFFKPIEHFEATNRRSQSTANQKGLDTLVKSPQKEVDCPDFLLNFELEASLPFDLELSIFDNQENILHTQIIEANTLSFKASLAFLEGKVGKYYWRLKANTRDRNIRKKYKSVVRSFFVYKGLNPYK